MTFLKEPYLCKNLQLIRLYVSPINILFAATNPSEDLII